MNSTGRVNFAYQQVPLNDDMGSPVTFVQMTDSLTVTGQLHAGSLNLDVENSVSVSGTLDVTGGGYASDTGPGKG